MKVLLDAIIWLGVLFPLLTGGLWVVRDGHHYGIYSPNIGLGLFLVITLFIFLTKRNKLEKISELSSIKFLNYCKRSWLNRVTVKPVATLIYGGLFFTALYLLVSLKKHWTFNTYFLDVGVFTNTIWNLAFRGEYISSLKGGKSFFLEHQSPVFWLWAPIYRLFPRVETLLVSQAVLLAAGGIAVFFLGRQVLGKKSVAPGFLPFIYWLNPAVLSANNFEFHPEIIILPAGLWALVGIQSDRKMLRWLSLIPFLLFWGGKESSGPLMTGIGLSFLLGASANPQKAKDRWLGFSLIGLGALSFYACTILVPRFFGGTYAHMGTYSHLGRSIEEVLLSPFMQPGKVFQTLFGPNRFKFFWFMLFPLGFLPLLSWRHYPSYFIGFLMLFMTGDSTRLYPRFHYGIESSVGLFWALPFGIRFLQQRVQVFNNEWRIVVFLLICTVLGMRQNQLYHSRVFVPSPHYAWLEKEVLPVTHPEASLSVPSNVTPYLANRYWVHFIPQISMPNDQLVDCVFVDPTMGISPLNSDSLLSWVKNLSELGYKEVFECKTFKVFQNGSSKLSCLIHEPRCP